MADWFKWNGVSCTEYGIYVSDHPKITIPKERITYVNIPGKSGSLQQDEGDDVYEDLTLSVECIVSDTSNIRAIGAWLRGNGTVCFGNRPDGYYYASISNEIPFEKVMRGKNNCRVTIVFRCKPFFYAYTDPITLTEASATALKNETSFSSEPVVTVHGTATQINLMIGGYTVYLNNVSDNITIDCASKLAYKTVTASDGTEAYENYCTHVTLESDAWPTLESGYNPINWTPTSGSVTSVVVEPNWRTL